MVRVEVEPENKVAQRSRGFWKRCKAITYPEYDMGEDPFIMVGWCLYRKTDTFEVNELAKIDYRSCFCDQERVNAEGEREEAQRCAGGK